MSKEYYDMNGSHFSLRQIYARAFSSKANSGTFSQQSSLPRLPIPSITSTISQYLDSLKPILKQSPEIFHERYNHANRLADHFVQNLAPVLQNRLIDLDRASPDNWLGDSLWANVAYLQSRDPLPINSNWWICCVDDETIPLSIRQSTPPKGEFTPWQVLRAAHFIRKLADFKIRLDSESIPPESSKFGPLCMHQYSRCFGVTRIPGYKSDTLLPIKHPNPYQHCIVFAKGQAFKLNVFTPDGNPRSRDHLELDLAGICKIVSSEKLDPALGNLTGDHRVRWANNREHLLSLSPKNRESLNSIEDSLFVVSLDDWTRVVDSSSSPTCLSTKLLPLQTATSPTPPPLDPTESMEAQILNSSAGLRGHNRWFDKSICVNVESNTRAGVVGEHSPCDALVPSIIIHDMLTERIGGQPSVDWNKVPNTSSAETWQRLEWVTDQRVVGDIERAEAVVNEIVNDSDSMILWFTEFGSTWIKKIGRQPPDSFIQLALQLTYRKIHGDISATYETASTRLFLHGRTDVIRSLTEEAVIWVEAMIKQQADKPTLFNLLSNAAKRHNQLTKRVVGGHGCDRHLLGMKMMLKDDDGDSRARSFFDDEMFHKSQEWKLCTSGLHEGGQFWGTGYGSPLPDGYGINYILALDSITMGIESKKSCPETSTKEFRLKFIESLREMKDLCESMDEHQASRSKL